MRKLFKNYELFLLYFIGIIYSVIFLFRIQGKSNINFQYMLLEGAIFVLILFIIREIVMFFRLQKFDFKSVFEYSSKIYITRLFIVIIFYLLIWFSDYEIAKYLIILTGAIIKNVFPRPISKGFYITDKGYILNGSYYEYNNIERLNLLESGSLEITCNGKEKRVTHFTKKKCSIINEILQSKRKNIAE